MIVALIHPSAYWLIPIIMSILVISGAARGCREGWGEMAISVLCIVIALPIIWMVSFAIAYFAHP